METTAPKDPTVNAASETPINTPNPVQPTATSVPNPTPSSTPPTWPTASQDAPASDTAPDAPKKSSKMIVIILVVLIVLVLIVGAVYFMMLQGNKTAPVKQTALEPAATPTASPTPTPDTSNTGLSQDSQTVTQDLSNLDTQINSVDSALAEQAPNLQ